MELIDEGCDDASKNSLDEVLKIASDNSLDEPDESLAFEHVITGMGTDKYRTLQNKETILRVDYGHKTQEDDQEPKVET
jgi:hypothetical protein